MFGTACSAPVPLNPGELSDSHSKFWPAMVRGMLLLQPSASMSTTPPFSVKTGAALARLTARVETKTEANNLVKRFMALLLMQELVPFLGFHPCGIDSSRFDPPRQFQKRVAPLTKTVTAPARHASRTHSAQSPPDRA